MEGMQYILHRVPDGCYYGQLHWRVRDSQVEVNTEDGWVPVNVPLVFKKDYFGEGAKTPSQDKGTATKEEL